MTRPVQTALTRAVAQSSAERALPGARAAVEQTASQLATGYRIQRPSDDPSGFAQAKTLGRLQDRLAQYGRSLDAATLWVDRTQAELDSLGDLFAEASEVGIRAANGVIDPEAMAAQIESLRDEVISRLNAKSGDESLFAGNQTDTPPFDETGALTTGDFSGTRTREIAPGLTVTLNATDALHVDGVTAPDRLQALADAIRAGEKDAISSALGGVQAGADHYARLGGKAGITAQALLRARDAVEAEDLRTDERRASIEEVDLAEAMGEMQRRQVALEAALRATAASVQTSLLNYLS